MVWSGPGVIQAQGCISSECESDIEEVVGQGSLGSVVLHFKALFTEKPFALSKNQLVLEGLSTQSCPTLSNPMDCSLPGSSAHGIFQARVLEWGAIAFSSVKEQFFEIQFVTWPIC